MHMISCASFCDLRKQDSKLQILDVRTSAEYVASRIEGISINIPLDSISVDAVRAAFPDNTKPVYILCRTQNRSIAAAQKLEANGLGNLVVVEGGMTACAAAGLAMPGSRDVIDLERQVRIIAGLLVLAGFILGHYVAPAFHILSGFVGAGLVFAGATGWCGMAMILLKAPWNK